MKLHELSPAPGSRHPMKRVGRGTSSGTGKTAAKGHKGQKARAGRGPAVGFEGGQMPLQRRVPKRGFKNIFATRYTTVNLGSLEAFDNGSVVDAAALKAAGVIKKVQDGVKILGNGTLTKNLTVQAAAFSASAKTGIEAAGGKAEIVSAKAEAAAE